MNGDLRHLLEEARGQRDELKELLEEAKKEQESLHIIVIQYVKRQADLINANLKANVEFFDHVSNRAEKEISSELDLVLRETQGILKKLLKFPPSPPSRG